MSVAEKVPTWVVPKGLPGRSDDRPVQVGLVGVAAMWLYLIGYWINVLDNHSGSFKRFMEAMLDRRFLILAPGVVLALALVILAQRLASLPPESGLDEWAVAGAGVMAVLVALGSLLGALIALTDLGDNFGGAVDGFLMHVAAAVIAAAAALWAATWLRSKATSVPPVPPA